MFLVGVFSAHPHNIIQTTAITSKKHLFFIDTFRPPVYSVLVINKSRYFNFIIRIIANLK